MIFSEIKPDPEAMDPSASPPGHQGDVQIYFNFEF